MLLLTELTVVRQNAMRWKYSEYRDFQERVLRRGLQGAAP